MKKTFKNFIACTMALSFVTSSTAFAAKSTTSSSFFKTIKEHPFLTSLATVSTLGFLGESFVLYKNILSNKSEDNYNITLSKEEIKEIILYRLDKLEGEYWNFCKEENLNYLIKTINYINIYEGTKIPIYDLETFRERSVLTRNFTISRNKYNNSFTTVFSYDYSYYSYPAIENFEETFSDCAFKGGVKTLTFKLSEIFRENLRIIREVADSKIHELWLNRVYAAERVKTEVYSSIMEASK